MKHCILIVLALMFCWPAYGQDNDTWTLFWNQDETLFGYKDKNGVVQIEPKFTPFSTAQKFENIIAVTEEINGEWKSYYLTKAGKIVGRDSMHVFDNGYDCESEGFIRFRDHETDQAGMFDKKGEVAVPAEYSELTRVMNGMIVALKGAKRKHLENDEHHSWQGGKELLIDTSNHVLIDDFPYRDDLNFFSIKKTKTPGTEEVREYFLAKDGSYYSFINFGKEFRHWLTHDLLVDLTAEKLIDASFDTITWWSDEGWKKTDRRHFIAKNFDILKKGLLEILDPNCDYFVSIDGLNPFMYEGKKFAKYFNNCGQAKEWMYPLMEIVISHNNRDSQDHYEFLRTDHGYKLIAVTIENQLKRTKQHR